MRYSLSEDYRQQRAYAVAEHWGLAALHDFEQLGQATSGRAGVVLSTLGLVAYGRGDWATAEARLHRAIEHWRAENAPTELARVLNNLGMVLEAAQKPDAALRAYNEAMALLIETDSELDKVRIELSLGTLYFNLGNLA
jgi:tetratricopeptide (TPR) repeat protein